MIRRREFITLLGGAAAAWPIAARAQQAAKLPTVGFLGPSSPLAMREWVAAFSRRLRELGWIEGRTRAQALYVAGDPLILTNRVRINTLALVARLPAIYNQKDYVEGGGL